MKTYIVLSVFGISLGLFSAGCAGPVPGRESPPDVQARQAASQFLKAMTAEDLDAVIKVCAVPFFMDGQRIISDKGDLRREFARIFKEKGLTGLNWDIKVIQTFEPNQQLGGQDLKLGAQDLKLLTRVLAKGDYVVIAELKADDEAEEVALMVRIRDGQPKVAGLRD